MDHVTSKFHPLHLSTHDSRHDASCPAVAVFPHSLVPRAGVIGMKCKYRPLRKIPQYSQIAVWVELHDPNLLYLFYLNCRVSNKMPVREKDKAVQESKAGEIC